jgi:hypothetical protein
MNPKVVKLHPRKENQRRVNPDRKQDPGSAIPEIDLLAESLSQSEAEQLRSEPQQHRQQQQRRRSRVFLRGPFDWDQFCVAARLPGQALIVWLLVQHQTCLRRKPFITLPADLLAQARVSRWSKDRALKILEETKLIRVMRAPGCSPRIALLPGIEAATGTAVAGAPAAAG